MICAAECGVAFFRARIRSRQTLLRSRWAPRSAASSSSPSRCSVLQPPDVPNLAEAARISLTPDEVEEFAPKIKQVVDWFGQLQAVNLESIEPSLRADTEASANPRDDSPEMFNNRGAILEAVPSYADSYIRVPKVLNKE